MVWALSSLEEDKLESIKSLEEEVGVNLLAFSDYETELADLSDENLDKIKDLEDELKVSLIAVEKEK